MDTLDFRSREIYENPYPVYARLREHSPVWRVAPFDGFAIGRYDDVMAVLKNTAHFSSHDVNKFFPPLPGADLNANSLLSSDPPVHTSLRRVIGRSFTPAAMKRWEPRIEIIIQSLVSNILAKPGKFNFVEDFANPLPVIVISELLGIEADRREDFKRWSDDVVSSRSVALIPDPEERKNRLREVTESSDEMTEYFSEIIERRKASPGDDLVSLLLDKDDHEVEISPSQLLGLCRLILVAGNETTTHLLGNTLLALLRHPDQMAKVRGDSALIPQAIEETLRYDGPVLSVTRRTTREVEIGGVKIPAERLVLPLLGSANHDERRFENPEIFDVQRKLPTGGHAAFGYGIHFCVGAPLARIEARMAIKSLLDALIKIELVDGAASGCHRLRCGG
jgi:cytochrome P450